MTIVIPHWFVAVVTSWPFAFACGLAVASAFWLFIAWCLSGESWLR